MIKKDLGAYFSDIKKICSGEDDILPTINIRYGSDKGEIEMKKYDRTKADETIVEAMKRIGYPHCCWTNSIPDPFEDIEKYEDKETALMLKEYGLRKQIESTEGTIKRFTQDHSTSAKRLEDTRKTFLLDCRMITENPDLILDEAFMNRMSSQMYTIDRCQSTLQQATKVDWLKAKLEECKTAYENFIKANPETK